MREIKVCRTFSDLSTPLHFLILWTIGALCFLSQPGVPDHFLVTSRQTHIRFWLSYINGAKRRRLGKTFQYARLGPCDLPTAFLIAALGGI